MPSAITLIRSASLSGVAEYAYAATAPAWEVVRGAFGQHDVPSTLMGVTVLGYKDQLVEIEAVAAVVDC